ncbi:MAG TPA: CBS domain-containing protein [Nitrospirae bacterium]|nr:CBS domain-containing protein [Nitrospirota bacterium]
METGDVKRARDIMNRKVITVSPDTSVEELGRLFMEKNVSGAPVIDENGDIYGIVTENDLISKEKRFHIPTIITIFDAIIPLQSDAAVEKEIKRMAATTVGDICTREVITVDEDATINDIATIMTEKKIHLLPVLKEGKLVGIVGKKDVIRAIAGESRT